MILSSIHPASSEAPSSPCGKCSSTATETRWAEDFVFDGMMWIGRMLNEEDSSPMEEAVSCYVVLLNPLVRAPCWLGTDRGQVLHFNSRLRLILVFGVRPCLLHDPALCSRHESRGIGFGVRCLQINNSF